MGIWKPKFKSLWFMRLRVYETLNSAKKQEWCRQKSTLNILNGFILSM